jgi:hypothetical protein
LGIDASELLMATKHYFESPRPKVQQSCLAHPQERRCQKAGVRHGGDLFGFIASLNNGHELRKKLWPGNVTFSIAVTFLQRLMPTN